MSRSTILKVANQDMNRLQQEHHDHLIDVNSGEITEFVNEEIEKLQKQGSRKTWVINLLITD